MHLTPRQNVLLHGVQSIAVGVAIVVLYVAHRIPADTATGVLAGLGGIWSAVGGALKLSGGAIAATPPAPVASAASAPPAAVVPPAPVSGPTLGPEHGAPA